VVELGVGDSPAEPSLGRRLTLLTGARLVFLTVLLGALVLLYGPRRLDVEGVTARTATLTLACAYALAAVYAAVLRSGRGLRLLADVQIVLDQITWTVVVYLSGGASSGATSFYGLTCVAGAALTGLRGASIATVSAVGLFVPVAVSVGLGWLPSPADQPASAYLMERTELAYQVSLNALVLVVVMLLSGYLAERLRLTGGRLVEAEVRAAEAERLAMLGRLASGLAHEIRNPLGAIAGSIQLLRGSPELTLEDRELCDLVSREAARLDDLVTDMLNLSRPRPLDRQLIDLALLAREVVALAGRSGRGGSDVDVVFMGSERAVIHADPSLLRQLVWNLVRNAVQASRPGDVVTVRVTQLESTIELQVEDEGEGIDPDTAERLFDAFFTTRSHGTGVGLAVVKRIADDHGFSVEATSGPVRGAIFRLRAPAPNPSLLPPSGPGIAV
jgi:two-component system sensor histidine kinase HydH